MTAESARINLEYGRWETSKTWGGLALGLGIYALTAASCLTGLVLFLAWAGLLPIAEWCCW